MNKYTFLWVGILGLFLSSCASTQAAILPETPVPVDATQDVPMPAEITSQELIRVDVQGAVTVEIAPVNLDDPRDLLSFNVGLNTHSVDLSMDLSALSTLVTDNGHTVRASLWDAPRGGHHVSGVLSFPASVDGTPVLDGAATLTLLITDLDVPERTFVWQLSK